MKYFLLLFLLIPSICFASEQRYVQIRFQEKTDIGEYSDCLYYKEGEVPPQKEIDAKKAERVANWIEIVRNPTPPPEPTKEQLIQQSTDIDNQIQSLQTQKQELNEKITILTADTVISK